MTIISDPVPWLDDVEARHGGLQAMTSRLNGELGRRLALGSQLSHADYAVLVALGDAEVPLRPSELGRLLGWEQSRVSHQLGRMNRRGLVVFERCDSDRRGSFVSATSVGRGELAAAAPDHVVAVRELFVDLLTPAQLATLGDITATVLAALDRAEPSSGEAVTI